MALRFWPEPMGGWGICCVEKTREADGLGRWGEYQELYLDMLNLSCLLHTQVEAFKKIVKSLSWGRPQVGSQHIHGAEPTDWMRTPREGVFKDKDKVKD